jgi:hypothetical protein
MARFGSVGAPTIPPPLQGFLSNGESTQAKAWARFSNRFAVNPTGSWASFCYAVRLVNRSARFHDIGKGCVGQVGVYPLRYGAAETLHGLLITDYRSPITDY